MLIAQSNLATLGKISVDISFQPSNLILDLNSQGQLYGATYTNLNYTLRIDFLEGNHEIWQIHQHNKLTTYSVWCGYPYQKQYGDIKNAILQEDQPRLMHSMGVIKEVILQTQTDIY
ncbi:MAG TPA: hypothetical protein PKD79_02535 [Candidatus Doudnabacteria bacterium]|nr:hypothetical protein [Candidatus Doudnabacteria bacterium]